MGKRTIRTVRGLAGGGVAHAFLRAFEAAPGDTDIEFRLGDDEHGNGVVVVAIGSLHFGFSAQESDTIARIIEDAIQKFGVSTPEGGLSDLALGLRHAAAKLRESAGRADLERASDAD